MRSSKILSCLIWLQRNVLLIYYWHLWQCASSRSQVRFRPERIERFVTSSGEHSFELYICYVQMFDSQSGLFRSSVVDNDLQEAKKCGPWDVKVGTWPWIPIKQVATLILAFYEMNNLHSEYIWVIYIL